MSTTAPLRRMTWDTDERRNRSALLHREWLLTNGLGGYASGTIAGVATRRYHGYLVANPPAPLGRLLVLPHLSERLRLPDGTTVQLADEADDRSFDGFVLESGLPVWRYRFDDLVVEKRVLMLHEQNTVHVTWTLVEGDAPLRTTLMPFVHFRGHGDPVDTPLPGPLRCEVEEGRVEVRAGRDLPPLRLFLVGERRAITFEDNVLSDVVYPVEKARGYDHRATLESPLFFRCALAPHEPVTLIASIEPWDAMLALSPEEALRSELARRQQLLARAVPAARTGIGADLVLAADQFLVRPVGRLHDAARLHAIGSEARSVIAGYPWFTDWGRDTMIALEGLALVTGRTAEACDILRTFAGYVRNGLIPNLFPEGDQQGLYHTADATLWFFHALARYVRWSQDRSTVDALLPVLLDIARAHVEGTDFGIHVDPADGLLAQGADGYQLTWMDAKVDDWVVTPRRGKAVEINALWYDALRLLEGWLRTSGQGHEAREIERHADRCRTAFNERFWSDALGHLYDVVDGPDGDDPACRPNQIFAISLDHPVLDPNRWAEVVGVVEERLLTPVGLRSLARDHPDYEPTYDGDLRARDAAYHQGTVWAWLIGPFVDAWVKVHGHDPGRILGFLAGLERHLGRGCLGTISEIFDAEPPFTERGCFAQAWSVAEVLRCHVLATGDGAPAGAPPA